MEHHSRHNPHQHRVTALFGDHEQSFELEPGTTLVQLTERLAALARQNHGWPIGITVLFDKAADPARRIASRREDGLAKAAQTG